jgi:hypothetical protein
VNNEVIMVMRRGDSVKKAELLWVSQNRLATRRSWRSRQSLPGFAREQGVPRVRDAKLDMKSDDRSAVSIVEFLTCLCTHPFRGKS